MQKEIASYFHLFIILMNTQFRENKKTINITIRMPLFFEAYSNFILFCCNQIGIGKRRKIATKNRRKFSYFNITSRHCKLFFRKLFCSNFSHNSVRLVKIWLMKIMWMLCCVVACLKTRARNSIQSGSWSLEQTSQQDNCDNKKPTRHSRKGSKAIQYS